MSTALKWIGRIVAAIVALFVAIISFAGFIPTQGDPVLAVHGAGASSIEPSYSGLQREFPVTNEPVTNPTTEAKAELGWLLFYDPILSENNELSCASCHHPDLGFSDGLPVAMGPNGALSRNTPTLWNVAYAQNLFWDGRLDSLETQSSHPLTHPDEMGVTDTEALVAELTAVAEYRTLFADAFGDEEITFDEVEMALAAFERTLIADASPFDAYAAGNFDALTAQQRRGLALFRSGATRCFECHTAPTFASDNFRVIGVDSDDPGRAAIAEDGSFGAFKVPTLRNIALTAPYMHDGSMSTLEEVVQFYADGGGRAHGAENMDVFVQGFEMSTQEQSDLVSFLYALTDEAADETAVPDTVPSGLPVVDRVNNRAWSLVEAANVGGDGLATVERDPITITVQPGQRVQTAVDRAQPGDTVLIPYGIYNERVVIDISDLTFQGIPNEDGEFPIFDGQGKLSEAVIASGNNFTVGNLHVRNYTDNGVLVEGVRNVHFHDIKAENTGTYGIYPVQSTDVLVERMDVTGVDDAGIYAGQCENVIVRDSVVYGNVLGIELENTVNGEIYNNHTYNNTVGIFVVLLPQLTSKRSADTLIYDNLIENNNLPNFAPEGSIAGVAPAGLGVLLLSTDGAEVYDNVIRDNKTAGVAIFSLTRSGAFDLNEIDVGDLPENNWIRQNEFANNAYDVDPFVADLGVPGGDILWDVSGVNNRFDAPGASSFPPLVPSDNWPRFWQRSYENIMNFLVGQLL